MITYFPWSKQNLDNIVESFCDGNMPTLDLELSALCGHRIGYGGCIYCDSATGTPHPNELSVDEIKHLVLEAKHNLDLRWLYCCGLGEPSDDPKFTALIEFVAEIDVSTSIFTNGIGFTRDYLRFLLDHSVSLLIKCDSFDPEVFG